MSAIDDIPEPLRSMLLQTISDATQRTTAWMTEHFNEIMDINAEDAVMAQLHYASRRDAGELDPDPRKHVCLQCGRMKVLELALIKLWLLREMGK